MIRSKLSALASAAVIEASPSTLSTDALHKNAEDDEGDEEEEGSFQFNLAADSAAAELLASSGATVGVSSPPPSLSSLTPPAVASWKQWENTLNTCVKSIVSIRVNLVASFDTERSTSTQVKQKVVKFLCKCVVSSTPFCFCQASGFIVDAARGIILTNRHVVSPNPVTAEAVFNDHEEVPIWPIYRDPVHDFG